MRAGFFLFRDDPVHDLFRRVLTREFTAKRIDALCAPASRIVERLMRRMAEQGAPTDFVDAVALPLPSLVICELLGVASPT